MEHPSPPEIVIAAHSDLARVQALLEEDPSLIDVLYEPWAETPLGAASHVGNRPIAEFLLARGAQMTITTAAMLGQEDVVARFLAEDPAAANAAGAHGISLLFHAALSGNVAVAERIVAAGGSTAAAGHALHAAVMRRRPEMVAWLLDAGADPNVKDFQGRTPLAAALEMDQADVAARIRAAGGRETT